MSAGSGAPNNIIVIDNGTGFLKAGFASDNLPRHIFPSIVGRPVLRAEEDALGDVELKDIMIGDEAAKYRSALEVSYPLENGIVRRWDDMELIWSYLFTDKLKVDPKEHRVILTEAPMNPRENRVKMISTMFEKFGVEGMQVGVQAMLTLYGQGLLTGTVLDSGDGVTHIVTVYDGFVPEHLVRRLNVAGRHITKYFIKLLLARGYAFNRTADFQTVQEIKEKMCYVALDPAAERKLARDTTVLMETYRLPDGRDIKVGAEKFEAPEALFSPYLVDEESPGMADLVFDVINAADMDMRSALYGSIVLSGGTTMYRGLPSRLEHDLRARYLRDTLKGDKSRAGKLKLKILDPPRRKHLVFHGGSVLGEIMAPHDDFWIWKKDFEEEGVDRIVQKFFGAKKR